MTKAQNRESDSLSWAFVVERMTGIEPAYSAWEPACQEAAGGLSCTGPRSACSAVDRWWPLSMAREWPDVAAARDACQSTERV